MGKLEAVAFLQAQSGGGWIGWDNARNEPDTSSGRITLDGQFTKAELLALVACFQEDFAGVTKNSSAAKRKPA
jgi:hypothetical protein